MIPDGVPAMLAYWTSDLRCAFANRAYLEWFGRDAQEIVGQSLRELLGEQLFQANEPYLRGVLRGEAQAFERTLTRADGSTANTWAQYVPDVRDGGVQGFFALVTDITRLKQFERSLRAHEAEERKLALIAARTHNGVILADAQGRIEWVNEGFERMTGYTLDEVRGRSPGSFLQGPESDRQATPRCDELSRPAEVLPRRSSTTASRGTNIGSPSMPSRSSTRPAG